MIKFRSSEQSPIFTSPKPHNDKLDFECNPDTILRSDLSKDYMYKLNDSEADNDVKDLEQLGLLEYSIDNKNKQNNNTSMKLDAISSSSRRNFFRKIRGGGRAYRTPRRLHKSQENHAIINLKVTAKPFENSDTTEDIVNLMDSAYKSIKIKTNGIRSPIFETNSKVSDDDSQIDSVKRTIDIISTDSRTDLSPITQKHQHDAGKTWQEKTELAYENSERNEISSKEIKNTEITQDDIENIKKIQAVFRGSRIRKNLKNEKLNGQRADVNITQAKKDTIDLDKINESAVLKIQAAFRGKKVRNILKKDMIREEKKSRPSARNLLVLTNSRTGSLENSLRNIPKVTIKPIKQLNSSKLAQISNQNIEMKNESDL